jgi:hypothetical protein
VVAGAGDTRRVNFGRGEDRYYTRVKQYHPDKVMGLGEEFQKLADDKTKEINEAFESAKRTLR